MERNNLEKYYKFVYECSCGRVYGSDNKEEKHICPICENKLK